MSEQVNTEIFNTFEILTPAEADKDQDDDGLWSMEKERKFAQDEFKNRWGWIDLAASIRQTQGGTLTELMQMSVIEVLTLATYVIDKVENIKAQHGNSNTGSGQAVPN